MFPFFLVTAIKSVLIDNPGAIVGFIVGITCLILIVAITAYTLIRRGRRIFCSSSHHTSSQNVRRALNPNGEQLLEEPHSFTLSWSGSSGIGEGQSSSRHLTSPEQLNAATPINNDASVVTGLGKIQFTVAYDKSSQDLQVSVLRCIELCQPDANLSTVDSYVKMELLPEKRHRVKTRIVRSTRNPFFGEVFTLSRIPLNQFKAASLHFIVVGFDRHSRDSVIGEVVCPIDDLQLNLSKEVTLTKEIMRRRFHVSFT